MDTFQLTGWKAINYIANLYVATMRLLTAQSARQSISQPSKQAAQATQATLSQSMASAGWVVPGSPVLSVSPFLILCVVLSFSGCHVGAPGAIIYLARQTLPPNQLGQRKRKHFSKPPEVRFVPQTFANLAFIFHGPFGGKLLGDTLNRLLRPPLLLLPG